MPNVKNRGFFDKINNAFFMIIDSGFDFLEKRGWNIPIETRFFFHTLLFIALFYFSSSIILDSFFPIQAILIILIVTTFGIANIRPIRQLFGYYTSDVKVRTIINKVLNNQIDIKAVVDHLNKNLLPPHLTLGIIRAYQKQGKGLPPQLIRAVLRQPASLGIVEEVIKNDLNDADFSLLMRKYKNLLHEDLLLKVVKSQKLSECKLKDVFFYQVSAYKVLDSIINDTSNKNLVAVMLIEQESYRKNPMLKNFLRNHYLFLSLLLPLVFSAIVVWPVYLADKILAAGIAAGLWILLFEFLYSYLIQWIYLRV